MFVLPAMDLTDDPIDINNVGVMAQALFARGDPKFDTVESAQWQAAQVSITSVANCLGRVIFGKVARSTDWCLMSHRIERRRGQESIGIATILFYQRNQLYIHRIPACSIQC